MQVIIKIFKQAGCVTDYGLIALSGLIVGCREKIDLKPIGPYVKHALESNENECTKLACGIISDLSEALQEKMAHYIHDFVPLLIQILKSSDLDRRIKPHALRALCDFSLYCGDNFNESYLEGTLDMLKKASEVSLYVQEAAAQNDEDSL